MRTFALLSAVLLASECGAGERLEKLTTDGTVAIDSLLSSEVNRGAVPGVVAVVTTSDR